MKTAFRYAICVVLTLLTACASPVPKPDSTAFVSSPTPEPVLTTLSLNSTSDQIRQAMLESTKHWQSVWVDGTVTGWYTSGANNPPQVYHEQVWIEPSVPRFRTLLGSEHGPADKFTASDGNSLIDIDLKTGQSRSRPLPTFAKEPVTTGQTLWGQIGTPMSEIVLSANYAAQEGIFKVIQLDEIADRQTLVVEWTRDETELPQWRMWLDTKTAVILKLQEFDKGGGNELQGERVANQVSFDDIFPDMLFDGQSASLPEFSDKFGVPLVSSQPAPQADFTNDPLSEVYFTLFDHNYGNETSRLMRVPGSCVAGISPCPEAQEVKLTGGFSFANIAFTWTHSGDAAAYVYPVKNDGNRNGLFVFDPVTQSSQKIAEFNFIDPPLWSTDGTWLAFRVQDGYGRDEIYAVRRDGSQLTNLSANDALPKNGQPYIMNGWLEHGIILGGSDTMVYLVNMDDGSTRLLFDAFQNKSFFSPSPDGSTLVYLHMTEYKTALKMSTPEGEDVMELIAFSNASIYPLVWSLDGTRLAFAKRSNDLEDGQDIYVIGQNGLNLQQVYHSKFGGVTEFSFSPDGKHLLLSDSDATGQHLFVIDLETLEPKLLQIPNLPLDWWWMFPSWRP
ncbi:MAG TPA: hypothetical protein VK851_02500 [Anaerolineales bacterium]|nr:hypothetical protein [Anaerolineales bacterium]